MRRFLIPLILSLPSLAQANPVMDERNIELIKGQFDQLHHHASINCEYKWWLDTPAVETVKQTYTAGKSVSAQYKIKDSLLNINITAGGEKGIVDYELAGVKFSGTLSKWNYIHLDLQNLNQQQLAVSNEYNLNSLTCSLEIAYEDNYVIKNKDLHIAMHPYTLYDLDGESTVAIVKNLQDTTKEQLILLDDVPNIRKGQTLNINEFLLSGAPDLPIKPLAPSLSQVWQQMPFDIPEEIPMRVAPAGHLRFTLTKSEHEITYTGGNHNYCIMNSTRRMLNAFFENPGKKKIVFNYVKEGVVVQWRSFKGMSELHIPKKVFNKSNLLARMIENMTDKQRDTYFDGYFNYFTGYFLGIKQYMFKEATVIRRGVGVTKIQKVNGKGSGDITIEFNYI